MTNSSSPQRAANSPAPPALAGLDDDRTALRRARHGERPAGAEPPAVVVQPVHLARVGEDGPAARSRTMASSSQVSQWPSTISMNSSARS